MNPTKKPRIAHIWEDGMRTDPTKKSFEWWYFDANFSDGSTLVIVFFTKQAQDVNGPLKPHLQIIYTTPEGERIPFNQDFPPETFWASTGKCDVKMGENTVSGNLERYNIHLDLPEIAGDIEFKRVAPSYSTTEHRNAKPVVFGWFPAIPYGTVTADLTHKNKKLTLKGTGYHDHNWGSMNMNDIIKYWYWGRGVAGDYYTVFSVMYLPKYLGGEQASIFYLARGDTLLVGESNHLKLTKTDINPPTPKANHLPHKLTFTESSYQEKVTFTLSHPKMIESTDPFTGVSKFKMFLTHLFSKPAYVRYNSDLEMEIEINGKDTKVKGKGLYEIMILR